MEIFTDHVIKKSMSIHGADEISAEAEAKWDVGSHLQAHPPSSEVGVVTPTLANVEVRYRETTSKYGIHTHPNLRSHGQPARRPSPAPPSQIDEPPH